MNIQQANQNWTELGESDPMWAILTDDDKRGGKWRSEEFFATGREEIDRVIKTIREAGVTLNQETALDFGCGLGRLSQALSAHFKSVQGVDVSASMVRKAEKYNKYPERVHYHLNVKTDLSLFPRDRFDFIYSSIVLQHIPTPHQLLYIAEFMDLLRAGGVAYFQTLQYRGLRRMFPNWFVEMYRSIKYHGKPFIPMYGVRSSDVETTILSHGGHLAGRTCEPFGIWGKRYLSNVFLVVKDIPRN